MRSLVIRPHSPRTELWLRVSRSLSFTCLPAQAPLHHEAASALVPRLVMLVELLIPLVSVITQQTEVCAPLPRGHSFHPDGQDDFCGSKPEASAYPSSECFPDLAPASNNSYQQGLAAPFIVELFAAGFYRPVPGDGLSPVPLVTQGKLPTLDNVARTCEASNPECS